MTRLGLISLALSVVVGVTLGSPRVRGEPLWKTREGDHQNYRQVDYTASSENIYQAADQDTTRYVQLPTSVLNNLLADPELSPNVRQILSGNVPPQVVPIRSAPVPVTLRPKYQYNIQPRPQIQSRPQLVSVPQPQVRPQPQSIPQYTPQTQSQPQERYQIQFQPQSRPQIQPYSKPKPQYRPQVAVRPQVAAPSYIRASQATPVRPEGNDLLLDAQIGHLLRSNPGGARLIAVQPRLPALEARLPDNASLIRPDLVDTFRCTGLGYGYYADVDNDCQVFHICLPMQQLFPANFTTEVTYQFSFICPEYTIFSQDSMVCVWENEAIPCGMSEMLYPRNRNFFRRITNEDDGTERWATLDEPLEDEPSSGVSGEAGDTAGDVDSGDATGDSTGDSAGDVVVDDSAFPPASAAVVVIP